jgi:hypothetical protein
VRRAYWKALDEARDERDGKEQLEALVAELERAGFSSAARCLADDLDALVVHLRYPLRHRKRWRFTDERFKGWRPVLCPSWATRSVGLGRRRPSDRLSGARFAAIGSISPVFGVGRPSSRTTRGWRACLVGVRLR